MSTALTQTCCGYGGVAPTQRISLSNSAASADPGHHQRRAQAQLFAEADIDGGLIGGASLKAADFIAICRAAG